MSTTNVIMGYNQKVYNAYFIEKDQDYQNETTTYWFNVDGETYGVSDRNGQLSIVDSENYPVNTDDARNIHLNALKPFITDELIAE